MERTKEKQRSMTALENCIAVSFLMGDREPKRPEMQRWAKTLGVSERMMYRYVDKISRARFAVKQDNRL